MRRSERAVPFGQGLRGRLLRVQGIRPEVVVKLAKAFVSLLAALGAAPALSAEVAEAWAAWQNGNIEQADAILDEMGDSETADAAWMHVRFLIRFVSGDYGEALDLYRSIPSDYRRLKELDQPYVDACRHLERYADASAFAKERGMSKATVSALERQTATPLQVTLDRVSVVPFANHPLTPYFPAFDAELNGQSVTAHVDTGGTFIIMGPQRAEAMGIETIPAGKGFHGTTSVNMRVGLANSFRLGSALLENVPVATLASLKGTNDFVVFGTSVLQQFYSTLDYPNQRLILSPRGDAARTAEHRSMLPGSTTRMPFYMWGDHYMFARGSVGEHTGLNFFIDSGLVSVHPGENGLVQAAFTPTSRKFREWGVPDDVSKRPYFQLGMSLGLGSLTQPGLYVLPGPAVLRDLGGVRIDGLLSHAFLKHYAWTIDFDSREYIFTLE